MHQRGYLSQKGAAIPCKISAKRKASLVQREVGFAQQNSEGLSEYAADLLIVQNDCFTIPHPLRGSSLCTREPFEDSAVLSPPFTGRRLLIFVRHLYTLFIIAKIKYLFNLFFPPVNPVMQR